MDQTAAAALPDSIRDAAFKSELKLKKKDYKAMSAADQKKAQRALTITPGLPSLEIVEAKPDSESVSPT